MLAAFYLQLHSSVASALSTIAFYISLTPLLLSIGAAFLLSSLHPHPPSSHPCPQQASSASGAPPAGQCSHHPGEMSKKIVVKLHLHDNKDKQKAMKAVSALIGIDEISVDMASQKMTVIGMVDPVDVVSKLRKASWSATIESVGPAKEPEKKEEGEKKDGEKKDGEGDKKDGGEAKKEGDGEKKEGDGDKKKEGDEKDKDGDGKKPPTEQQILAELMNQYRAYYPPYPPMPIITPTQYYVQSMEENPNSCTIC